MKKEISSLLYQREYRHENKKMSPLLESLNHI